MDSPQNFLEAWMNTQTKWLDTLTSPNTTPASSENILEKSLDLYKNWFNQQKNLADSLLQSFSPKPASPSDMLKEWLDSQLEWGRKWLHFVQQPNEKPLSPDSFTQYFDQTRRLYELWQAQAQHTTTPLAQLFATPHNPLQEPLHQILQNSQTYLKMIELWNPIYKMTQSNTMGWDSVSKMLDMEAYQRMVGNMFNFMTPEKSDTLSKSLQQYQAMIMGQLGQLFPIRQLEQFMPAGMLDKALGAVAGMGEQIQHQLREYITPYFTMIPAGREKDILGISLLVQEKTGHYHKIALAIQEMIANTARQAIEKAAHALGQRVAEQPESAHFDTFYQIWVDTMEADLIELFGSEKFSMHFGELIKAGLEIKAQLDRQMEYLLANLPLVPRSEMDEVTALVYELRHKVRQLEHQIAAIHTSEPTQETQSPAAPAPLETSPAITTPAVNGKTKTKATKKSTE